MQPTLTSLWAKSNASKTKTTDTKSEAKGPKKRKVHVISSDEDEISAGPDSPRVSKAKDTKKSKSSTNGTGYSSSHTSPSSGKRIKLEKLKTTKSPKKEMKPVDVMAMFGEETKRIEAKKPPKPKEKALQEFEDDEIDQSLMEVDLEKSILESQKGESIKTDKRKAEENHIEKAGNAKEENQTLGKDNSSKTGKATPKEDETSPNKNENQTLNKDKSSKKEKVTPKKDKVSPKKEKVAPKEDKASAKKEKMSPKADKVSPKKDTKSVKTTTKKPSVFLDDQEEETPKKKKAKQDLDTSVLSDEERHERKRFAAILYQKYKNRSAVLNHGCKEIPKGKPNCLAGLTFLVTGVLESMERDEAGEVIKEYGGKTMTTVGKRLNYLIVGEDAGLKKLAKAEENHVKVLSEDDFFNLIREKSGLNVENGNASIRDDGEKPSTSPKQKKEKKKEEDIKEIKKEKKREEDIKEIKKEKKREEDIKEIKKEKKKEEDIKEIKKEKKKEEDLKEIIKKEKTEVIKKEKLDSPPETKPKKEELNNNFATQTVKKERTDGEWKPDVKQEFPRPPPVTEDMMTWVDRYKPASVKEIIGQQGPASNVVKLTNWLSKWYINHDGKKKLQKPNPWAKNDDGSYYKAALLSGPPGIGKTTTATLVCKELGFDVVEFNASDTRSKRLLQEEVSQLLSNKSLYGYCHGQAQAVTKKHVLIMDEVDGMAGNEDRGGIQELISLIKDASVPIICMCNDRNHQKMRSLVNYCYDLRFNRPQLKQIKGKIMSICAKENIKLDSGKIDEIITATNNDIRQSINHISLLSAGKDLNLPSDKESNKEADKVAQKDLKMGPWEVVRKVFSAEEHKTMTFYDKCDLFFHDYSLSPLFVQQNYLIVNPSGPRSEVIQKVALTADSLSLGDLVDKKIRSSSAWSLLPTQAVFSSVMPGEYMCGNFTGQINFPGWLGKNSRATKRCRLAQEIHDHTRVKTSGSRMSVRLDYAPFLLNKIVRPLAEKGLDGVEESLQTLKEYHLLREDIESLIELSTWPGKKSPMDGVDGKVKAALTRAYNKEVLAYTYSAAVGAKKKRAEAADELAAIGAGGDATEEGEEGNTAAVVDSDDEEKDDDLENDALVKTKKKTSTAKASSSKASSTSKKATTSKAKTASKPKK